MCGEDFSEIRAEDGPAWLTVLMLGPFLVPIAFMLTFSGLPDLAVAGICVLTVLILVPAALPRVKGGFIAALWVIRHAGEGRTGSNE